MHLTKALHCITSAIQSAIRQVEHEQPKQLDKCESRLHDFKLPKERKKKWNQTNSTHFITTRPISFMPQIQIKRSHKEILLIFQLP